jgi:hypothetical protein
MGIPDSDFGFRLTITMHDGPRLNLPSPHTPENREGDRVGHPLVEPTATTLVY